jgi:hypothetical protein
VARDAESLDGQSRMRVALGAQAAQRALFSRVRADVRKVQKQHPADGAADRILQLAAYRNGSAAPAEKEHGRPTGPVNELHPSLLLAPEAERALLDASRPMLAEHAKAQVAIEQSRSVSQPIELTDEDRAGALAFLESVAPNRPVPTLVQCDGYTRPFFEDDVDFYRWLEAHQDTLDAGDAQWLREKQRSEMFQLLLANEEARQRAIA